jgi:hypothetical protein
MNPIEALIAQHVSVYHDVAPGASAPLVCAVSSDPGRSHVLICPILGVSHVSLSLVLCVCQEQAIVDLNSPIGPEDRLEAWFGVAYLICSSS